MGTSSVKGAIVSQDGKILGTASGNFRYFEKESGKLLDPKAFTDVCIKVINDLAILVNMSMPEHIYLRDKRQKPGEKFSGRKAELREIKRRLDSDNFVFLRGMGGVGKSALAKKFAHEYRNEYHTCQFVSYGGSSMMTSFILVGILLNISSQRKNGMFNK